MRWIDTDGRFRLAVMPAPVLEGDLEAAIAELRQHGVGVIASLLTDEQVTWLGLDDEPRVCTRAGLEFLRFPIVDHSVPADASAALSFADTLHARLERGSGVAIHCLAGIGRSALVAALVLRRSGYDVDEACARISAARGRPCPETPEQLDWLRRVAG